jgi:hypothetical protein
VIREKIKCKYSLQERVILMKNENELTDEMLDSVTGGVDGSGDDEMEAACGNYVYRTKCETCLWSYQDNGKLICYATTPNTILK